MHYDAFIRHLTIRNVPPELAEQLEAEKRLRGKSLNQTVVELLREALGQGGGRRSNGLARLAPGWTRDEFDEFEQAIAQFEEIDEEMWR